MSEYRGFLFAIIFIIIFAGLLASVPVDLYGQGNNPDIITPIDPALITDFSDTESFQKSNFTDNIYWYPNILGGYSSVELKVVVNKKITLIINEVYEIFYQKKT